MVLVLIALFLTSPAAALDGLSHLSQGFVIRKSQDYLVLANTAGEKCEQSGKCWVLVPKRKQAFKDAKRGRLYKYERGDVPVAYNAIIHPEKFFGKGIIK